MATAHPSTSRMQSKKGNKKEVVSTCSILPVGKRRDGGTRYWCLIHKADATAKYGQPAQNCRAAHLRPILPSEIFDLYIDKYPGGVSMWGAVPPIYDTTRLELDRGIHIHARMKVNGQKCMDLTFRAVRIIGKGSEPKIYLINELDAIYYMVSTVFGFEVKQVTCSHCGYLHLDKDWFSVHPHKRHLCSGCGKQFMDNELGIGNPIATLNTVWPRSKSPVKAKQKLEINQADFPAGIQIWGSNPAFIWTKPLDNEHEGIHVHAYKDLSKPPSIDETYSEVSIDGIKLDPIMVRTLMAQNALPHLQGRIVFLACTNCGSAHFNSGIEALTPSKDHKCKCCGQVLKSTTKVRKVVSNPILAILDGLAAKATQRPQKNRLDLLPETLNKKAVSVKH